LESYDDKSPADKLTISYSTETNIPAEKIISINKIDYHEVATESTEKLFTPDTKFTTIFTPATEKIAAKFDDVDSRLFQEFIIAAIDADVDNLINENDYEKAFEILKTICEKNKNAYTSLTEFKNLIEEKEKKLSIYDKVFIVDKMKAILSYQTYLTDGYNDGNDVPRTRKEHMKLFGPDKITPYPLDARYKDSLKNNLKNEKKLYRTSVNNLIGFTAFYRIKDKVE